MIDKSGLSPIKAQRPIVDYELVPTYEKKYSLVLIKDLTINKIGRVYKYYTHNFIIIHYCGNLI